MATIFSRLNISLTDQPITPELSMVQYDSGRGLDIMLTNDVIPDDPGEESQTLSANLYAVKPSGMELVIPSLSVIHYATSGSYEVKFASQEHFLSLLNEVGTVECQVALRDSADIVTTFSFYIHVMKNLSREIAEEAQMIGRVSALELQAKSLISGDADAMAELPTSELSTDGKTLEERITDLETEIRTYLSGDTDIMIEVS